MVLVTTALAHASEGTVSVRYLSGYPLPNQSMERLDVRAERKTPPTIAEKQEVDHFFALVQATLLEYGIVGDWQAAVPDAASIEITIELDGRRIRLTSAHVLLERSGNNILTERGLEPLGSRKRDAVLAQQSKEYQHHRLAFEKLLSLTLEHVKARLSP